MYTRGGKSLAYIKDEKQAKVLKMVALKSIANDGMEKKETKRKKGKR